MPLGLSLPFQPRNPLPDNSAFGPRPLYNDFHNGVDFNGYTNAWAGAPIYAVGNGRVSQKGGGPNDVRGYWMVLDHGKDAQGVNWSTRYHILPKPYAFPVGTQLDRGDQISIVGRSGSSATGPHLHFELRRNGIAVDPMKYLKYVGVPTKGNAPAGGGGSEFEEDMPLTPADVEAIWGAQITANGKRQGIAQHLAELVNEAVNNRVAIDAVPKKVWAEEIIRNDGNVTTKQELANIKNDTKALVARAEGAAPTIDIKALAAEIVALLPKTEKPLTAADIVAALKSVSYKAQ